MQRAWIGLLVWAGCGGDDGPTSPTIGPEGGTVESADGVLRLDIPPGAVFEPTAFEITLVPEAEWPTEVPAADVVGNVYDVQPEGTTFAAPARLTWTYATAPANAADTDGQKILFALSVADAEVESASRTDTELRVDGSLVATNEIEHLGTQLLTGTLGSVAVDLRAGEHFVDLPWSAAEVVFRTPFPTTYTLEAEPRGDTVIVPTNDPGDWDNALAVLELGYTATLDSAVTPDDAPPTMPRWRCTAVGTGTARLAYAATVTSIVGTLLFEAEATCVVREEKPDFLDHQTSLGAARIENLAVPGSTSKNLATTQGAFGYLVPVAPAQTVEVCVSTTGSVSLLYVPRFPPGFDALDTLPGCTNLTNQDPDSGNDMLVEITGSGTINVTTRVIAAGG